MTDIKVTQLPVEVLTSIPQPDGVYVRGFTSQQTNGNLTTINVLYPIQLVAGDLLVAAVTHRNSKLLDTPAGWTHILTSDAYTTLAFQQVSVYTKVATGSESGTQGFTSTDFGRKNAYMFSIAGASAIGLNDITQTTNGSATTTPTWSEPTLYIFDWVLSGTESVTATAISDVFGLFDSTTSLRMYAGFNSTGVACTVNHTATGDGTEAVSMQLISSSPPASNARRTITINYT